MVLAPSLSVRVALDERHPSACQFPLLPDEVAGFCGLVRCRQLGHPENQCMRPVCCSRSPGGSSKSGLRVRRARLWLQCKHASPGGGGFTSGPQFPHLSAALEPVNLRVFGGREDVVTDMESVFTNPTYTLLCLAPIWTHEMRRRVRRGYLAFPWSQVWEIQNR